MLNDITDNFIPIFCAGFEDRSIGFILSLPENWRSQYAIVLYYPSNVFPRNEIMHRQIIKLCKNHVNKIVEIPIISGYSRLSVDAISKTILNLNIENSKIIIDISSMTKGNILSILDTISELVQDYYIAYTEPIEYTDTRQYGAINLITIPKFEGNIMEEYKNHCVYLMGFNTKYIGFIREKYEPEHETFYLGNISRNQGRKRNMWNKKAQQLCVKNEIPYIELPTLDVMVTANKIIECFYSKKNHYNKIIFPLGPKTFTLASFISHKHDPNIQVCYPKPSGWSDTSSYGSGLTHIYYIKNKSIKYIESI